MAVAPTDGVRMYVLTLRSIREWLTPCHSTAHTLLHRLTRLSRHGPQPRLNQRSMASGVNHTEVHRTRGALGRRCTKQWRAKNRCTMQKQAQDQDRPHKHSFRAFRSMHTLNGNIQDIPTRSQGECRGGHSCMTGKSDIHRTVTGAQRSRDAGFRQLCDTRGWVGFSGPAVGTHVNSPWAAYTS